MVNIFDFSNYREFLNQTFRSLGVRQGHKLKAAQAIGIQAAYLSRVLNGQADLSIEQAFEMADHLGLGSAEKSLFLLLVQEERAGSPQLKEYFKNEVRELREKRKELKNILENRENLTPGEKARYYSHWIFAALHILVCLPAFNNRRALQKIFDIDPLIVDEAIDFLQACGFIVEEDGLLGIGSAHIHLSHDSPFIINHHTNWRVQSIQSIEKNKKDDLRYTGVWSMSRATAEKLKENLRSSIEKDIGQVKESPSEEVYCYLIDFFKLT